MPSLDEMFMANVAARFDRQSDSAAARIDRQSDAAHNDMRFVTGALATAVLQADDPQQFAGLSTGIVVPSTMPHPTQTQKAV